MIDLRCSFLVVITGSPLARSKRICQPKTERVPVPVRSDFVGAVFQHVAHQVEVGCIESNIRGKKQIGYSTASSICWRRG